MEFARSLDFEPSEVVKLRDAFWTLDSDDSGSLNLSEIRRALLMLNKHKTPAELQRAMEEVDVDGSGELNFQEFLVFMQKLEPQQDRKAKQRIMRKRVQRSASLLEERKTTMTHGGMSWAQSNT